MLGVYQRPRGTRDYLPQDSAKRRKVTEIFRRVFELYGYGEVITPALEYLELLEAKAGPEVREQIYWFEDKAGRKLGLRFELTTSVARVVAERRDLPKPIKFYYIQPVWRYEEPQRGRLREFWHAGIEFMGTKSSAADAEVVAVAARALKSAGVDDVIVRVNSRKIAEGLADKYRVEQSKREDFFRILDKLEKTGSEFVAEELCKFGLGRDEAREVVEFATMSGESEEKLGRARELLRESERGLEGVREVSEVVEILEGSYAMGDEVVVDFGIVRGLGYYTGFVFEISSRGVPDVGSLAGGGRYDDLVRVVGGYDLPATGMSIGVERVIEVLEQKRAFESIAYRPAKVLVAPIGSELFGEAVRISERLRDEGIPVLLDPSRFKLRSLLDYADRIGVDYVVIVGERELREGKVVLRDMRSWTQEVLSLDDLAKRLK